MLLIYYKATVSFTMILFWHYCIIYSRFTLSPKFISFLDDYYVLLFMMSEDANFVGAQYQPMQTTLNYKFSSILPSSKTLYLKFANANGLETITSASIVIDMVPPIISDFKLDANTTYTLDSTVDLNITATDDSTIASMIVSETADFTGSTWVDYTASTTPTYTFAAGEGSRSLYIKLRDQWGLESLA